MAKDKSESAIGNGTHGAAKPAHTDDGFVDVTGLWARGMRDGEVIVARYLGYDSVVVRDRVRVRHQFIDAVVERPDATTGEIETSTPEGILAIFGATDLDNALARVELGATLRVVRLGRVEGQRRVAYRVAASTRAGIDTHGVVGRIEYGASAAPTSFGPNGFRR